MKTALIFGVTGQDGSYLSEYLLELGYEVYGVTRRTSNNNTQRIDHITSPSFHLIEGDITDSGSVYSIIQKSDPDEIYNLAAQSFVAASFDQPQLTFDVNTKGCLNVLEAVRLLSPHSRVLYAGSSEQFGSNYDVITVNGKSVKIQDEHTLFFPRSPYAVSKVAAHLLMKNYRESYNLHTNTSIFFNHCSPKRGVNFVTRKITLWLGSFLEWAEKILKEIRFVNKDEIDPVTGKLKPESLSIFKGDGKDGLRFTEKHIHITSTRRTRACGRSCAGRGRK